MKKSIYFMVVGLLFVNLLDAKMFSNSWQWIEMVDLTPSFSVSAFISNNLRLSTDHMYKVLTHQATGWVVGAFCTAYTLHSLHKVCNERDKYRNNYVHVSQTASMIISQLKKREIEYTATLGLYQRLFGYKSVYKRKFYDGYLPAENNGSTVNLN